MTYKPSMKKWIAIAAVVAFAFTASGCRVPTNADGSVKLITSTTTFADTMSSENWFNAILVWPMAQFLNKYSPSLSVSGALAILTLVVNLVLMLATMKSTIASQQMQLMTPEMNKIQRKYEGKTDENSRMKMANEQSALYKKYNINPLSAMLVQFLQFPVVIAMYNAVQRAEAVKTGSFFGLSLATKPIDGIKAGTYGYIFLFLIMIVFQYLSMKVPTWLANKRAREEAESHHRKWEDTPNKQNEYMQLYMVAMIAVFGLMWPAAMALYWTIYSMVNIAKTYITQFIINHQKPKEGTAE